jgi:hypothetical protein
MPLAPIILFVYNRPEETEKTLNALRQNFLAKDSDLYIFSDAAKDKLSEQKVREVRQIIHSREGFKSITIIEAEKNKGLANSVIDGVTNVIKKHRKAIVLEDDLISSPNFLLFMNQALDIYENNKQIISISGLTFQVDIPKDYEYDVYFTHRMSSYGWGTWFDRWESIDWEVKDYDSFRWNWKKNLQFMRGGEDLPRMLVAYMKGKINSWAIRFAYHQYKTGTYTVYPTVSKVDNIGFDSAGTHTTRKKIFDTIDFHSSNEETFRFPGKVVLNKKINNGFLKKYRTINRIIANYIVKK